MGKSGIGQCQFGDARLSKRLCHILADKLAKPTASTPQASGSWAASKAAYRFFSSKHVSAERIRAAHADATRARVAQFDTVLMLQDTTELLLTSHPRTAGLGALDHAGSRGLNVYSALVATLSGVPLGLIYQQVWARKLSGKAQRSRKPPQAQRESQRWLTTLAELQQALPAPPRLIAVADREADIYPLFVAERDQRTELVICAIYNLGLVGGLTLEQVAERVEWAGTRGAYPRQWQPGSARCHGQYRLDQRRDAASNMENQGLRHSGAV